MLKGVLLAFTCEVSLTSIRYSSVFPLLATTDSCYPSFSNTKFINKILKPETCLKTVSPFVGAFPLTLPVRHPHDNIFNSHFTGFINDGLQCRNHYFTSFQTKSLFGRPLASKEVFKSLPKRNTKNQERVFVLR